MTIIDLQRLEIRRSTLLQTKNALVVTSAILIIPAIWLLSIINNIFIVVIIVMPILSAIWYNFNLSFNKFRNDFKEQIIGSIILQLHSHIKYYPDQSISRTIFDRSRIFINNYTDFKGEDLLVSSDYGNLQLGELQVIRVDKNKDRRNNKIEYLKGIFGVATFPFKFAGITVVYPRGAENRGFNGQKVILESPRFMEKFEIESTSQIEARLALGTDIMNNILYLHDELKTQVWMSFVDNQVFFAIQDASFLEPQLGLSVLDNASVVRLKKELEIITQLIQTFKLHQN